MNKQNKITALDVAKFILSIIDVEQGEVISNLKLQKLLYYSQGFTLALYDKPLFDDKIEAWQYGPVVPNVYDKYQKYGYNNIPPILKDETNIDSESKKVIHAVYKEYGQFSAFKLVEFTHNELPWKEASEREDKTISLDTMKKYFKNQINE
ncbi:MAG: DUF4065 domain-containing protein [Mycoplasmataceae bacterium]|nr:DUF4065 domain-containing protein [Mycoplasmataceae bacterium]